MDCPHCGYVMDPFEKECPRCARLGRPASTARPGMPAQQSPAGVTTAPPVMRRVADGPRRLTVIDVFAIIVCILILIFDGLFVVLAVLGLSGVFGHQPQQTNTASSLLSLGYLLAIALRFIGAIGYFMRRQWCGGIFALAYGIDLLIWIIFSVMVSTFVSAFFGAFMPPNVAETPGMMTAGPLIFLWLFWAIFRALPAVILRSSISARMEEDFE